MRLVCFRSAVPPAALSVALMLGAAAIDGAQPVASAGPLTSRSLRFLMGTSMSVEVSGGTPEARDEAIEESVAAIREVDRLMSNYRPDSELAAVNRGAAIAPVHVSAPLFSVLAAADAVSRRSAGAFDITVGPLMRLWGFFDKAPHVPTPAELAAVRPVIGFAHVQLNPDERTVRFDRAGVELDLGGIAKGFAVELAGGVIARRGLTGAIDAGGNQFFVGTPPGKPAWQVGIQDPEVKGGLLGVLTVEAGAVSTSGGYHNYFVVNGRRYGHLLDPRTLQPSEGALSVTVVSRDATLADALTKPAFILGPKAGLALIESFPGALGLIAYRGADGRTALVMSAALTPRFRPVRSEP